jgi:hypothetical protein
MPYYTLPFFVLLSFNGAVFLGNLGGGSDFNRSSNDDTISLAVSADLVFRDLAYQGIDSIKLFGFFGIVTPI